MRISVVAFDGFSEIDTFNLLGIINQMRGDGWRADLVCAAPKINSANGIVVASQRPLEWVTDSDAVFFGSSTQMQQVVNDEKIVRRLGLDPDRQLIGAMCNASLLLQRLHLLPDAQVCAEQASFAALIQAGLKPFAAPLRAHGNVATAGGRLAASYLAAWAIWRLEDDAAARHALFRVAPAGEHEAFLAHVMGVVAPFIEGAAPPEALAATPEPLPVAAAPLEIPAAALTVSFHDEEPSTEEIVFSHQNADFLDRPYFSGVVQAVGQIAAVQPLPDRGLRIRVSHECLIFGDVAPGNAMTVNGVCLTVASINEQSISFDCRADQLPAGSGLDQPGQPVNLEKALRFGSPVGGHLMTGQIDGTGEVLKIARQGETTQLAIQVGAALAPLIALRGFVAINGVSVSPANVRDAGDRCVFTLSLVGPLLQDTALPQLQAGHKVLVETDQTARFLQRCLHPAAA